MTGPPRSPMAGPSPGRAAEVEPGHISGPDFATMPVLSSDLVTLRVLTGADEHAIMAMYGDSDVRHLTGSHSDIDPTAGLAWLVSRAEQADRLDLAIVERMTGACVGEGGPQSVGSGQPELQLPNRPRPSGPWPGTGHRGDPADRRLRLRAARPAPDLAGGLRVQPAGAPGLRESRIRGRRGPARITAVGGRARRRHRDVDPRPRVAQPPPPPQSRPLTPPHPAPRTPGSEQQHVRAGGPGRGPGAGGPGG
jgi:hypothetical protein